MMDFRNVLLELGIRLPDLLAGFAGGVAHAFVIKDSNPFMVLGSVVVGALAANYLVEPAAVYFNLSRGPAGFIIGLTAMVLCQGLIAAAKSWRPFKKGGGNGPA